MNPEHTYTEHRSAGRIRREDLAKARADDRKDRRKARANAKKGKKPHRCLWGEERHEDGSRYMVCGICGRRLRICSLPQY